MANSVRRLPRPVRPRSPRPRATPRFHKPRPSHRWPISWPPSTQKSTGKVVFMIDEAHLLSPETLEELRLLSSGGHGLELSVRGDLIGQPTLSTSTPPGRFAALDSDLQSVTSWPHGSRRVGRLPPPPHRAGPPDRPGLRRTMRPRGCTATPTASPVPSTTPARSASCWPPPTEKHRPTTSVRRKPVAELTRNWNKRASPRRRSRHHAHRSAPSRVLTQSCRTVLTQ